MTNSVYEGNGGIAVDGSGTLTLDRVTVSGNEASYDGGGIYMTVGTPVTTVTDSTITGNRVDASLLPDPSSADEAGGGIEIDEGTLQLSNSTIADNTLATGAAQLLGGGIFDDDTNSPTLQAANTIVAENSPDDCGDLSQSQTPMTETGPNLDSDSTCFAGASDQHANPNLQSLYPNGGQTDTMALSAYSPAIDAGRASSCPAINQRGISRPPGAGLRPRRLRGDRPAPSRPAPRPPSEPTPPRSPEPRTRTIRRRSPTSSTGPRPRTGSRPEAATSERSTVTHRSAVTSPASHRTPPTTSGSSE